MKRLRQITISGDVYSEAVCVVYNDAAPAGLGTRQECEAFRRRLLTEGWRAGERSASREDWTETYSLEVEAEAPAAGLFVLTGEKPLVEEIGVPIERRYCESGKGMGQDGVAVGVMDGRWVAYLIERGEVAARVVCVDRNERPVVALTEGWWFVGVGEGVQAYRRMNGRWVFHGLFGEKRVAAVAVFGGRVAVMNTGQGAVRFYAFGGEKWELEGRVEVQDYSRDPALVFGDGLAAAGDAGRFGGSGCVDVLVERKGGWALAETLRLADGRMGDRFGSRLSLDGGVLTVGGERRCWVYQQRLGND